MVIKMSQSQVERYRRQMSATNLWPAFRDARHAELSLRETVDPTADVLVWKSSSRHPMDDALAAWLVLDYITEAQATATTEARDRSTAEFLSAYRANPPQPGPEERAEMRDAFGPGARVVNAVTGQAYNL